MRRILGPAIVLTSCFVGAIAPAEAQAPDPTGPYGRFAEAMKKRGVSGVAPNFFAAPLCPGCREVGFFCTTRIRSVSDLNRKVVRIDVRDQELADQLRSTGARPTVTPGDQIREALRRGVIQCVAYAPSPDELAMATPAAGPETPSQVASKTGAKGTSPQTYQYLDALGNVLEAIRRDFVGPTDERKLIEAAIRGVLQSLDSSSTFYSADDFKTQREAQRGKFGGIGIEVREKDGVIAVVTPIDGTPGARAGLQPGDLITHVDDTSIKGLGLAAAVARMRGPLGTKVGLTVVREGQAEPLKVVLVRETITVRSVTTRADGDVGYVRITRFDEPTLEQLRTGIRSLTQQIGRERLKGFVLDLRNNPGGLLNMSITVADEFLDKGEIVAERRRRPGDVKRHSARPGDVTGGKPLVVLVNRGTAGSAEVLAGALNDHRRAIVVGSRSFGSGSIGTIVPLKQLGGAFRLTTAHLVRPSGRLIEGNGIDPDHVVEGNPTDPGKDKTLQFALQLLRGEVRPQFRDPKQKPEGGLDLGGGDFK